MSECVLLILLIIVQFIGLNALYSKTISIRKISDNISKLDEDGNPAQDWNKL